MATEGPAKEISDIIHQWEEAHSGSDYDPTSTLTLLSDMLEVEYAKYLETNPDPFDERHPSRIRPTCAFGNMLKIIFRKEAFMNKLVSDYLKENYFTRNHRDGDYVALNTAACRLTVNLLLGLEAAAVLGPSHSDTLIKRLFAWSTDAPDPLQTYAIGFLSSVMENQDMASDYRDDNSRIVPVLLDRLSQLENERKSLTLTNGDECPDPSSPQKDSCEPTPNKKARSSRQHSKKPPLEENSLQTNKSPSKANSFSRKASSSGRRSTSSKSTSPFEMSDFTKVSWQDNEPFVLGLWKVNPLSLATKEIFILKYLTSMAEYQENLVYIFEKHALDLILGMVNPHESEYTRVSFEALKYLAALLCHKKFAVEFIGVGGVQHLLEIRRPSLSAIGASVCFYYLAYCEDSMERVCLLPNDVLLDLVSYNLWLLKYRHDSGRCHATMFFGFSFLFLTILNEFDRHNGLCDLYNVMSTVKLLVDPDNDLLNEDEESSSRQVIRHVCVALKRYLEAHLFLKVQQLQSNSEMPTFKVCKATPESVAEQIETVLELLPFKSKWEPVDKLYDYGAITLLLRVIMFASEWNYPGRIETVRSILDILNICATIPQVMLQLCEVIEPPDEANNVGLNVILGAAEGEIVADPEVQKAALNVLITCVCAPMNRTGSKSPTGSHKRRSSVGGLTSKMLLEKVWECIRVNNGIMLLLSLLTVKTPLTEADSIRCLACQALVGLARSETVRQILSVLPLFTSGELTRLMRDPILQEKRQEHVKFQQHALFLLERVCGKKPDGSEMEVSLSNIHRANVIAQTKIQYNEKQLLTLIHQHLLSRGMKVAAAALQKEAELPESKAHSQNPFLSPFSIAQGKARSATPNSPVHRPNNLNHPVDMNLTPGTPSSSKSTPIKIKRIEQTWSTPQSSSKKSFRKHGSKDRALPSSSSFEQPLLKPERRNITLDSIVTEYLTNQHALCKNPMVVCPQFNLFVPHKCPDPKPNKSAPCNFTLRYCRGINSRRLDQRLIHSRFCPVKTLKSNDEDDGGYFTCCEFFGDKFVIAGTYGGEVKVFNINTGVDDVTYSCHESYISNLECNRTNNLLLTSSPYRQPLSAMWKIDGVFEQVSSFENEEHVEFSKLTQDRIVGTNSEIATIYDVETKKQVVVLAPKFSNQYNHNIATFNPTDELVLSDGILWDVNAGKQIYKFDKLNQSISGRFHPNGLEIVSNTEIWDLRTFRLLKTVPALDQCSIMFSPTASVIYAAPLLPREPDDDIPLDTSFKTFDSYDYSSIATIDLKRNIYHIAVNKYDTNIAIIENQGEYISGIDESNVRIYDVGRSKDDADENEVVEDEEEDDLDNSGSGSDDDDDDDDQGADAVSINLLSGLSDEELDDDTISDRDGSDSESDALDNMDF